MSNEEAEEKVKREQEQKSKEMNENKEAYVEGLDSDELFQSLFAEDADGKKLNLTPGAEELLTEYCEKFVVVCKEMYEFGKSQKELRVKEVSEFWKCFNEAKTSNTEDATVFINAFMEYKKIVQDELSNNQDQGFQEAKINEYNERVTELWEKLMALEVQVVDQIEVKKI